MPPEAKSEMVPWLFRSQKVDDREGFLPMAMQGFP